MLNIVHDSIENVEMLKTYNTILHILTLHFMLP